MVVGLLKYTIFVDLNLLHNVKTAGIHIKTYIYFFYMKLTSEPLELVSVEMEHTYKFCFGVSLNIVQ